MDAALGGVIGLAVMWGVKHGVYSNEAGLLSATAGPQFVQTGFDPVFDPRPLGITGATFWESYKPADREKESARI